MFLYCTQSFSNAITLRYYILNNNHRYWESIKRIHHYQYIYSGILYLRIILINIHSLLAAHFSSTSPCPAVMWYQTTQTFTHLLSHRRLSRGGKRLNAFEQNGPLIFPNSWAFINHTAHQRKHNSSWGDLWAFINVSLRPAVSPSQSYWFMCSWITVYWTFPSESD